MASPGEEGFTLIELLIVLIIIPLVMGAIATVLITTLKDQTGVQGKLADSGDATVSSEYFVRDVESASAVMTPPPASAPAQCSPSGLVGTPQVLLGIQLLAGQAVVWYDSLPPTGGGSTELVRLYCSSGSTSLVVLSHNFNAASSSPVVSCITPPPANIPMGVTCSPTSGWTPTYMVSNVALNVIQGCPTPPGPPCTPAQFSLTADPVSGVPVPPIVQTPGALTLLATGNDIQFQDFLAGGTVCASGPILLKSGWGNGAAISGQRGDSVTSGSTCGTSTSSGVDVYNCNNGATGNCPGSGPNDPVVGVAVTPSPVSATQVNDPLSAWALQPANQVPAVTSPVFNSSKLSSDCTVSGTGYSCPAGLYSNGLSIPSNSNKVTFQGGATGTQFGQVGNAGNSCNCALTVGDNDTVFFGSGHYSYEGGLAMTGVSSALCAGPGTGQCAGAPAGGVFFYVQGGQIDFGSTNFIHDFSGPADLVQLSAISTPSDPYNGKLIWQDGRYDNDSIELVGYASASNNYNGEIYAPNSPMQVYGLGFSMSTEEIVADSLTVFSAGFFSSGASIDVKCPSSGC